MVQQGEDSFVEIAPRFQTNWLQLWFLNPMVGHPDHARTASNQVAPAAMINVGRIYKPRWDDTVRLAHLRAVSSLEPVAFWSVGRC